MHRTVCLFTSQLLMVLIAPTDVRRDGQAELTWVAGYVPRLCTRLPTVTHPSTNRARRRLTSLMRPTTEPNRHLSPRLVSVAQWHMRAEPETVISRAWVQSPDPAEQIVSEGLLARML